MASPAGQGEPTHLPGPRGGVLSVAFGRAGDRPVLAAADGDGVWLWDMASPAGHGKPTHLPGPRGGLGSVAFGRAGDRPVLAAADIGGVWLWDMASPAGHGKPTHLPSPRGGVWSVAFGQAGNRPVLAASGDGGVWLWEIVEERLVGRPAAYRSDAVGVVDELSRVGEARALADLLTARTVRPPLAVGLFGHWGEGKSHFLELLQAQVAETAGSELACQAVRQVRFNAWHYAESSLWAGLVAELFAQLAAPPGQEPGAAQRTMSRLTADLVAQRHLPERLRSAQKRLSDLQRAMADPEAWWKRLEKADQAEFTGAAQGRAFRRWVRDGRAPILRNSIGKLAGALVGADARTKAGTETAGTRTGRRRTLVSLAAVGTLAAVTVATAWALSGPWHVLAPVLVAATALAGRAQGIQAQFKELNEDRRKFLERIDSAVAGYRDELQNSLNTAAAEVAALDRESRDLTAAGQLAGLVADRAGHGDYRARLGVMTRIREDFQNMARLLAQAATEPDQPDRSTLTAPNDPAENPVPATGRSDRGAPDTAEGRPRAGGRIAAYLRKRTRPQAQAADERDQPGRPVLMTLNGAAKDPTPATDLSGRGAPDAAKDRLPAIDRIVVYIDDLDRCPPARVVEMLEAIHLLLAVDLFVVVVAIDPRWLLRAITANYRDVLSVDPALASQDGQQGQADPDGDDTWASTPAQYLEKIFQVVFTLPTLDTDGYHSMLRNLVGTRADQPTPAPPGHPPQIQTAADDDTAPAQPAAGDQDDPMTLPAARIVERVDPLTLDPEEITLLDLLGPPHLISTPRSVKRLANSYGLLTALRRDHRAADLAQTPDDAEKPDGPHHLPYRAAAVLLAAMIAYPALGPGLCRHLHYSAADDPGQDWSTFVDSLRPRETGRRWSNGAETQMTRPRAQAWLNLANALTHITDEAERLGLPLPGPLKAWARWTVPVARLSFPAGSALAALQQEQLPRRKARVPSQTAHRTRTRRATEPNPQARETRDGEPDTAPET
ncbi:MAG TPA: P-loop NTPase fold protein [Actinocrinis sp.]|nr:P-loop NTPase fold protein [Actinocrinis sp.]